MSRRVRTSTRWRAWALLPLGAYAVHQLRFYVAFGGNAGHELAAQGHAYLGPVVLLAGLLAAVVAGEAVARLARAWRGDAATPPARFGTTRLWVATSLVLVVVYLLQEFGEGLLLAGHPEGIPGMLGSGGWVAVPLAVVVGALIALALRGVDAAIALLSFARCPARAARRVSRWARPSVAPWVRRRDPLADSAPTRGPPVFAPTQA